MTNEKVDVFIYKNISHVSHIYSNLISARLRRYSANRTRTSSGFFKSILAESSPFSSCDKQKTILQTAQSSQFSSKFKEANKLKGQKERKAYFLMLTEGCFVIPHLDSSDN